MKLRSAVLLIACATCSSYTEPGGTYTLTGNEKGVTEIVKADMAKYPDLYKGETLGSYVSKFKKENRIGKRKLSPGDQLTFPATQASLDANKLTAPGKGDEEQIAVIECEEEVDRLRDGYNVYSNPDHHAIYDDIPRDLKKFNVMIRERQDRTPINFKVNHAGYVFILAEKGKKQMLSNQGWIENGTFDVVTGADEDGRFAVIVFKKHFDVGTHEIKTQGNYGIRLLISK